MSHTWKQSVPPAVAGGYAVGYRETERVYDVPIRYRRAVLTVSKYIPEFKSGFCAFLWAPVRCPVIFISLLERVMK